MRTTVWSVWGYVYAGPIRASLNLTCSHRQSSPSMHSLQDQTRAWLDFRGTSRDVSGMEELADMAANVNSIVDNDSGWYT